MLFSRDDCSADYENRDTIVIDKLIERRDLLQAMTEEEL